MGKIFLLATLFVALCACSTLENLVQKPTATFKKVDLKDASFTQVTLRFTFDVANPNAVGVSLDEISYGLDLDQNQFIAGSFDSGVRVESMATSSVSVPVTIDYRKAFGSLQSLLHKETIAYKIAGHFKMGPFQIPYSKSGNFVPPKIPELSFKTLELIKLDPLRPQLALKLNILNENNFPIPLAAIDYALNIGERKGVVGRTALSELASHQNTEVTIPVQLSLAELGATLGDILSGAKKIPVSLDAHLKTGGTEELLIQKSAVLSLVR